MNWIADNINIVKQSEIDPYLEDEAKSSSCNCLPSCTSIGYEFDVSILEVHDIDNE